MVYGVSKSLENNTDLDKDIKYSIGPSQRLKDPTFFDGISTQTSLHGSMPGQGTVDDQATWQ